MGNNNQNGSEGYYDENGNFIGGYYDEDGFYVDCFFENGYYTVVYYDKDGNYVTGGYYEEDGTYVSDEAVLAQAQAAQPQGSAQSQSGAQAKSQNGAQTKNLTDTKKKSANTGRQIVREESLQPDYDDDLTYEGLEELENDRFPQKNNASVNRYTRDKASRSSGQTYGGRESRREITRGSKKVSKKSGNLTVGRIIGRVVAVILAFLLITFGGLYMTMRLICKGPSSAAKDIFVSTILETGQMKFLASWYFTKDEIKEITSQNSMGTLDADVDTSMITVGGNTDAEGEDGSQTAEDFDIDGIELVEITGRTFLGKMLIINDPSRVKLSTIYDGSWAEYGKNLDEFVTEGNYIAGVNGGEYQSDSNKGGTPKGVVVCDGEIQFNSPQTGDVLIGFNTDDILIIRDVGGMTAAQAKALVEELNIRDAVTFKDIDDGDDNHFAKLIINGEAVKLNGSGSGANPRTVIGQRADGTVLILVTDGRGSSGHLGATAADVISIMQEYGAVNAANMDGGSSSSMYYDGNYEMTSVTLYYANSSWRLPLAFVVERRGE